MEPKETWIKETLESADGISRATANPFLYDKVMTRMRNARPGAVPNYITLRRAIAFAMLLIALNVVTIVHYSKTRATQSSNKNAFTSEYFSYMNNY